MANRTSNRAARRQQAETLGIVVSFDENFWNMGACVIATFPTHNGAYCDSALAWLKDFSSRDDAEDYALMVAIRNASPNKDSLTEK